MTKITIYQNDKLYDINFTLKDANDTVVDLTSATLLFKAQKQDSDTAKFSGSMSIVSAAAGTCKYTVADGDFDAAGIYYAEVEVTFSGGKVLTFGDITIDCRPQIPQ